MKQVKLTFLFFIFIMVGAKTNAHDFVMPNDDGVLIYYSFINSAKELAVTFKGDKYNSYSGEYSGTVVIPETVNYGGKDYCVTSIGGYAFAYCSGLTSVEIPNSVTSIGNWAFGDCSGLSSVTIPNSVTSIGDHAFSGCSGLKKVIVKDIAAWCKMGFYSASDNPLIYAKHLYSDENTEITNLVIPDDVTIIGNYAFCGCSSLTSVEIPNSVTSIGNWGFGDCSGLSSVIIPNSVTSIGGYAFSGCAGLTSVEIPNSVTSIGEAVFCRCSDLTSVTIPNSVMSIGKWAFEGSGLTSIEIPNSVTSIGSEAFSNCSSLTSMIVDAGNTVYDSRNNCNAIIETSSNTLIQGCNKSVIPNSVTSIGEQAFRGCRNLTSVTIPNSVTSIGERAFCSCGLTSVTIPNSVTSIGQYTFSGCSNLTSVEIPNSVTSIKSYAFYGCSGLTSIEIPNSVTSIGSEAFSNCFGLTSVTINSNTIMSKDYPYYDNIQTIFGAQVIEYIIGNDVTSIGDYAFYNCSGLTSVTISNSVTSTGTDAFYGCSGLTSVTMLRETPFIIRSDVFSNRINATLYVPKGSKSAYENANYWKEFKEIVEIEPSGIKAVENDQTAKGLESSTWFTLDGRRLSGKPTKHGIYIVNGRKVVVK